MPTTKQPPLSKTNAFTIGYGTGGIKLPIVKKKGKRGLSPTVKYGPIPILRPDESEARKAKKNT